MDECEQLDVVIIGAGISGIAAAQRIQQDLPNQSYAILEARNALGGTWDFFRFPGIRSDTDLITFGFSWYPWTAPEAIAQGHLIRDYLKEAAAYAGIDKHIRYGQQVTRAEWSSKLQRWKIHIKLGEEKSVELAAKYIVFASGYYDYTSGMKAEIPGLDAFDGQLAHPQFWPQDLSLSGKRVTVIGSGATAVTLLPSVAEQAEHVTMLQRSPSYILPVPAKIRTTWVTRYLPSWLAFQVQRLKHHWGSIYLWFFCRLFPKKARQTFFDITARQLPNDYPVNENFSPKYEPWDQRICFTPGGDFYKAIRQGKASVVTDTIQTVGSKSITTTKGHKIESDIIITATGLKMQLAGGVQVFVDGERIQLHQKALWRSAMLQDVPNVCFLLGYAYASWTPGAEMGIMLFCRVLRYMQARRLRSVVPRRTPASTTLLPFATLNSTYIQKGINETLKTGNEGPWRGRLTYFADWFQAKFFSITDGLEYS